MTAEKGDKIAGFLFEPIQGEAGVSYFFCPFHFLKFRDLFFTDEAWSILILRYHKHWFRTIQNRTKSYPSICYMNVLGHAKNHQDVESLALTMYFSLRNLYGLLGDNSSRRLFERRAGTLLRIQRSDDSGWNTKRTREIRKDAGLWLGRSSPRHGGMFRLPFVYFPSNSLLFTRWHQTPHFFQLISDLCV